MPVSSPSYFPPSRGTDQIVGITAGRSQTGARVFLAGQGAGNNSTVSDIICIGDNALANGESIAQMNGAVVIGSGAAAHMSLDGSGSGAQAGPVLIGFNVANTMLRNAQGCVMIGANIAKSLTNGFNNLTSIYDNTFIGANILGAITGSVLGAVNENVLIGAHVFEGTAVNNSNTPKQSVVIGTRACVAPTSGTAASTSNVIIGYHAGAVIANASSNVVIGNECAPALTSVSGCVLIGNGIATGSSGTNNIVIGEGSAISTGAANNTCVGAGQTNLLATTGNIRIGYGAAGGNGDANYQCVIEYYDGATHRTAFYSNMGTGNTVLGNSDPTNRETGNLANRNCVKILNGSYTATPNPTGGGFFYVNAGALHWVGSSGTDTVIAPA